MMGEYKHGKQKREMPKEEFYKVMEQGIFVKPHIHKPFLVLLYYIGCRKSEALELTKENFKVTEDILYVDVLAKKHGVERASFKLKRELPYLELITERVKKTRKGGRVFPFNGWTAWKIVKRAVGEKYYPHFFRLNRTVKFLNNPKVTLNEIRQWMAWKKIETVNNYLGYSERTIGKLSGELE